MSRIIRHLLFSLLLTLCLLPACTETAAPSWRNRMAAVNPSFANLLDKSDSEINPLEFCWALELSCSDEADAARSIQRADAKCREWAGALREGRPASDAEACEKLKSFLLREAAFEFNPKGGVCLSKAIEEKKLDLNQFSVLAVYFARHLNLPLSAVQTPLGLALKYAGTGGEDFIDFSDGGKFVGESHYILLAQSHPHLPSFGTHADYFRPLNNLEICARLAVYAGRALHLEAAAVQKRGLGFLPAGKEKTRRNISSARMLFDSAMLMDGTFSEAPLFRGELFDWCEEPALAEADYALARKLHPEDCRVYVRLGLLHSFLDERKAGEDFKRALELKASCVSALNGLGLLQVCQGKFNEALASFEKAVQADSGFAESYANLGRLYERVKRFEDSSACFAKAVEYDPDTEEHHLLLASSLERDGRAEDALKAYNCGIESIGRAPKLTYYRAGLYEKLKEPVKALADYRYLISLGQNPGRLYHCAGDIEFALDRPDKAREDYIKGLEKNPGDLGYMVKIAKTHAVKAEDDEALSWLRKALNAGIEGLDSIAKDEAFADFLKRHPLSEILGK